MRQKILLVLFSIVLAIVFTEFSLRVLIPSTTIYSVHNPGTNRSFRPNPDFIPGVSAETHFKINENGIRGPVFGSNSEEFRILMVGGSTTENLYLDEDEHWPAVVNQLLAQTSDGRRVWIGNVGRSGMNSRDHVLHVKYLLPQYPRIDVVVVLVGVNDLVMALGQGDDYRRPVAITDPQAETEQMKRAFALVPGAIYSSKRVRHLDPEAPFYKVTAIWQIAKRAEFVLRNRSQIQDSNGRNIFEWRSNRQQNAMIRTVAPEIEKALTDYTDNLSVILDRIVAQGAIPVFMTQPTLWKQAMTMQEEQRLWLGAIGGEFTEGEGTAYYSSSVLADVMNLYNQRLLSFCDIKKVSCFDLANVIPRNTKIFYDDAHFTRIGAREVGMFVADFLVTSDLLP